MSNSNHCGFRDLFTSVWCTFKTNYLLCLGLMVPILLLSFIMLASRTGAGIWVTGDGSDVLAGQIASIASWLLFSSLVMRLLLTCCTGSFAVSVKGQEPARVATSRLSCLF